MAKPLIVVLLILAIFMGLAFVNPTSAQSTYKFSGYVSDINGNGLAGAYITLNLDGNTIAFTNGSGYFEINAPANTYTATVYPPFDSNYLFYNQQGIVLTSNLAQNFTLNSGYKVSGYIKDQTGAVVPQARFALVGSSTYVPGWYSNMSGYYFATAPAGTYTLTADPRTGIWFNSYSEPNVVLSSNIFKNITVSTLTATPTPTPTSNPTEQPTQITSNPTQTPLSAPNKTPTPTPNSPANSVSSPSPTESAPEIPTLLATAALIVLITCTVVFAQKRLMPTAKFAY